MEVDDATVSQMPKKEPTTSEKEKNNNNNELTASTYQDPRRCATYSFIPPCRINQSVSGVNR